MPVSSLGTGYSFTATNLASGPMAAVTGSLGKLGAASTSAQLKYDRAMRSIKRGALEVGVGLLGLGMINRLSKDYGKFEMQLVSAGTVMRASASDMERLKTAAIEAGIATAFSPTEAAQGLQDLGAAGMNASEAIKALNPVLDLAAASLGQLGVAEAAQNAVGVLNAFGETADMAGKRVDQLVRVTQMSNFQARDFSIAISQAAAQANSADQTFESMIATLGILRNTNLAASAAATAYREATRRVAGDTRSLKKLRELGLDTLDKETGKIKDLSRIVAELNPKLSVLNAQERNLALQRIFGVRGMKTYSAITMAYHKAVKEGKVEVGDFAGAHRLLVEGLNSSEGAAAKTRDALLKTAEGQRILLKGSIETFKVMLGQTLTPVLLPALKATIGTLNAFIKVLNAIPAPVRGLISSIAGVGLVMVTMRGIVRMVSGARGLLGLRAASAAMAAQQVKGAAATATQTAALKTQGTVLAQVTAATRAQTLTPQPGVSIGGRIRGAGRAAAGAGRRAMGALASPLGIMGIAVGAGVISAMRTQAEEENKRADAVDAAQKRMQAAYERTAKKAEQLGVEAGKAGQKIVESMRQATIAALDKSIIATQQRMDKLAGVIKKKTDELNLWLSRRSDKTATKQERKEAASKVESIRGEILKNQKKFQSEKATELQLSGLEARRKLRSAKTETERHDLRTKIAAGHIAGERLRMVEETKLTKQAQEQRARGSLRLAKQTEDRVKASETQRLARRKQVGRLLGLPETTGGALRERLARVGAGGLAALGVPTPGERVRKEHAEERSFQKFKTGFRDVADPLGDILGRAAGLVTPEMPTDFGAVMGVAMPSVAAPTMGVRGGANRFAQEDMHQFAQILTQAMKQVNINVPVVLDGEQIDEGTDRNKNRAGTETGAPQKPPE